MGGRNLLNLGLLLFALLLAGIALWEPGKAPPQSAQTLTRIDPETVQTLHIKAPQGGKVMLRRREESWWVSGRQELPANPFRVDTLLNILASVSHAQYNADEVDTRQLGLAPPQARLRFDQQELHIGAVSPINQYRYVRWDDQIHLLSDSWYHLLQGQRAEYVSLRPFGPAVTFQRLELPGLVLARGESGWRVNGEPPASVDGVNGLLDEWRHLRALQVKPRQERPAEARLRFGLQGEPGTLELDLVAREPELILSRPAWGVDYYFSAALAERLLQLPPAPESEPTHLGEGG